jgi:hypothetical protein
MNRNSNRKNKAHKHSGKNDRKSGNKNGIVIRNGRKPRNGNNPRDIYRVSINETGLADEIKQKYMYAEIPTLRFNTAVNFGSINYIMSGMDILFDGGSTAVIPYWTNEGLVDHYRKYRVVFSSIKVEAQNREAVNPIYLLLTPATSSSPSVQTAPVVTSAAAFTELQSYSHTKLALIAPVGSGPNTVVLRDSMAPAKLFGEQYHEQDEYSGTITSSSQIVNPTRYAYWNISYFNPAGNNTAVTGGLSCRVTLKQTVLLYEVERDTQSSAFFRSREHPNEVDSFSKVFDSMKTDLINIEREKCKADGDYFKMIQMKVQRDKDGGKSLSYTIE